MRSLLIHNAQVFDGTGSPAQLVDVAVAGDRIAAVGASVRSAAAEVLDATGLALAPGFIDIHSHTDLTIFAWPSADSKIAQGVTTEVTGNCGIGAFPVAPDSAEVLAEYLRMHGARLPAAGLAWSGFAAYALALERLPLALNLAPLTAHGALRIAAMGSADRPPDPAEHATMQGLLQAALAEGAWGMSTGLIYPPGSFAATAELIALARVLARAGALYTSHIRGEGATLRPALEEAVRVARESGARVQVSHLKALGQAQWGQGRQALAILEQARTAGLDVAADQYPYEATSTTLSALVPAWAHAGGVEALLQRLASNAEAEQLRVDIRRSIAERGGPDRIVVASVQSGANGHLTGQSLAAIAKRWGVAPEAATCRLLREERAAVGAVFFSLSAEDVQAILVCPWVAIGSDGQAMRASAAGGSATHPRSYGTFPRVLGHYVRDEAVLPLDLAIHKMTGFPARRLGLADRGEVRPGWAADLVLFDPARIGDRATFAEPHQYAEGITHVFVNGRAVVRDGRITGDSPGRVLRRALG
jgi:N-acyl-D-amino-acid deacylase